MKDRTPQVSAAEVVFRGRRLEIQRDSLTWKDGATSYVETVRHPGAVAILAYTSDGKVILEKQYRHSIKGSLYEVPAGTLEQGEDPAICASRELLEETGYRAETMKHLGAIYTSPGYSSEVLHLFLAKAAKAGAQRLEDDESISVSLHDPGEALRLVMKDGTFDAKSVVLLQMAMADPGLLA